MVRGILIRYTNVLIFTVFIRFHVYKGGVLYMDMLYLCYVSLPNGSNIVTQ